MGSNAKTVTGEWGYFVFKMVDPADIPGICDHLANNFFQDEPLISLCPPDPKYCPFMAPRIAKLLTDHIHLSFIALNKSTNEIAGCQLQFKWTKEEAKGGSMIQAGIQTDDIPEARKLMHKVLSRFDQAKIDMFDKFGVEEVAWNFMASVEKKYRGKGLASEMYRRMIILLQKEKFKLAFSLFTSPYSRRSAEKVGFFETDRINFIDVLDEEGKQILPNAKETDFASLMVRQIN